MLTYEQFVAVLLNSIERRGLNVAYTQELLDTHALGRSLTITCLPDGFEDDQGPQEPPLRAVIAFRWSPEFTIFSLRGGDSLGDIERMVDERLAQARTGSSLDVDVTYTIPLQNDQSRDIEFVTQIARSIQELHATVTSPEHLVRIETVHLFAPGRAPRVQSMTAHQTWSLDEALYDLELLSDTFDELCADLQVLLELLALRYSPDELQSSSTPNEEFVAGDRRYLKPPTA